MFLQRKAFGLLIFKTYLQKKVVINYEESQKVELEHYAQIRRTDDAFYGG